MHPPRATDGLRVLSSAATVAIIPARHDSTRLPGKPLADIGGRPMIEHVYRRTASARAVDGVVVATDSERIADVVAAFGGLVVVTRGDHRSGSDRIAEVAKQLACPVVVNVQGDEPLVEPAMIDEAVAALRLDTEADIVTLCRRIADRGDYLDPAVVKVVFGQDGRALYFSRSPIPHFRGEDAPAGGPPLPAGGASYRHVGLYVYRRAALLRFAGLPPSALEVAESLEQLRALDHGMRIRVVETRYESVGVDTPEDLARVRRLMEARALQ